MKALPAGLVALLCTPWCAAAQTSPSPAGYAYEVEGRERWLHGRQRAEFAPWREVRYSLDIDSAGRGPAGSRALRISLGAQTPATHARVVLDPSGRLISTSAVYAPVTFPDDDYFLVRERMIRGSRLPYPFDPTDLLAYAAAPIAPNFHPTRAEVGATWTDTIHIVEERSAERRWKSGRRSMTGVRLNRIGGDTLLGQTRLWIVRDSATIEYQASWPERDRTLDTTVVVERRGKGTLIGRYLYDPSLGLFRSRTDSVYLVGEAVLRYPDGRTFRTPATYARIRRWTLHPPERVAGRRAVWQRELATQRGFEPLPRIDVERSLLAGNATVRDSLIRLWHLSRDPAERDRLFGLLRWGTRGRLDLVPLALAAGDTLFAIENPARPRDLDGDADRDYFDREQLELRLPFLRDPGVSLGYATARDPFYEGILDAILRSPPALQPDTALWPCAPDACRLLAAQYGSGGDPRLADLALTTRFLMEPRRWADEVRARRSEATPILRDALFLVDGIGATDRSAARAPLPAPTAGWREWLNWMGGRNPNFHYPSYGAAPRIQFDADHARAIRFQEILTGRDLTAELRSRYAEAQNESARLVFATILQGLGELWSDPAEVANALLDGSDQQRRLARRELSRLFQSAPPAEPAMAADLMETLLEKTIAGGEGWPRLTPKVPPPPRSGAELTSSTSSRPLYLVADDLPAPLQDGWRDRVTLITEADLRTRPDLDAGDFYIPGPVRWVPPFARLWLTVQTRRPRADAETPSIHHNTHVVTLLETESGWVQVEGVVGVE